MELICQARELGKFMRVIFIIMTSLLPWILTILRLKSIYPKESHSKIELMLDYSNDIKLSSVPDPYYEGKFDEVFEMVYSACTSFFESIVKKD